MKRSARPGAEAAWHRDDRSQPVHPRPPTAGPPQAALRLHTPLAHPNPVSERERSRLPDFDL